MKAAVLHRFKSPLRLEFVPIPKVLENDVLVRIKASGICHSDLHLCQGIDPTLSLPIIPGHECAGVVEQVGARVSNIAVNDRVICDYLQTCGNCYYCGIGRNNLCESLKGIGWHLDGAYAEYIKIPAREIFKLPGGISFEEGAIIGCAVVTAYHAIRTANLRAANSVAIFGIGGIGYHILKFSQALGARRIVAVDTDDRKLARAAKLGADTINPGRGASDELIKQVTKDEGLDIAFEAAALPITVESAIKSLARGGKVVLIGLCGEKVSITPLTDIIVKEIQILGSIDHLRTDIQEVIELVRQKKIDLTDSITHRLALDDVNEGLEMLESKQGDPVRIVMIP